VTRKVTWHAAAIKLGLRDHVALGNLDAKRDWGFAKDYVEAMWLMLQHDEPGDFVIATGESHTLKEFVALAFAEFGLDWNEHVDVDPSLFRPSDIVYSRGNPEKSRHLLGWEATTKFRELVAIMTEAERRATSAAAY
jgi:GDPmannose 4,6-dehydratase